MEGVRLGNSLEGVEIWKNPKNKFAIFQCHYLADPAKRSKDFKETIKNSMPRGQYMQEYELQWDSFAGLPVYPDFNKRDHCTDKWTPQIGLPLLRGWDFGMTPACIVAQLEMGRLTVIKEYVQFNMGIERFSTLVLQDCALQWPEWADNRRDWKDFIDPSGFARVDTDENTCAKVLATKGMNPIPGAIAFEERRQSVEHFIIRRDKEGPLLQVVEKDCPFMVRGFVGGYRYSEKASEIEPVKIKPLKDEHSHVHDALQMLTSKILVMKRRISSPIPAPAYEWSHSR